MRQDLYRTIARVNDESRPIAITTSKGKGAVLIGEDDWAAIGETLYLTGIPGMTETLTGARQLILPIACRRANSTGRPHVSCHATRVYSVFPAFFPASGTKPSLKALGMTSVPPDCFTDS